MKYRLVLLLLLFSWASAFAQQVDKKKNATYFSNGLQSKYREDTEGAIRNFEQALNYMPDDAASMFELSEQYYDAGRMEEAFKMIQQAASLDPDNKWYQKRLGLIYRNRGQFDGYLWQVDL